jgi:hypothetical protein
LHLNWLVLNHDVPIFHRLLAQQRLHHLLDAPDLFRGLDSGLGQSVSHASTFAHTFGDTVEQTELSRQVELVAGCFD